MSDQPPSAVLHSKVGRRRRVSVVWAIPIVTALIGGWLVWTTLSQRGPLITISFQTAEGLTANQSHVRHKDVDMGVVEKVDLSPDMKRVILTVRMNREAEPLLTDKARFWVVKPRFFAGSFTGLQTLVSGAYIELQPSAAEGEAKREFVGLEDPPVMTSEVPGSTFMLKAARIGSLSLGSPIFFRDFTVGEVLGWDVSAMAESVTIHAFVRAPFDKYVHDNSRFWNASGISVQLGSNGVQVQFESLRALVLGGIAFETPADAVNTPVSVSRQEFPLYVTKEAADSALYARSAPLIAIFRGSVAGLQKGASVTLKGIKIGEVDDVTLEYDRESAAIVVPVRFAIEPGRISQAPSPSPDQVEASLRALVHRGLRVRLESGSLITGQKQLSLELYPLAEPATLGRRGDAFVLPIYEDGGADVVSAATNLMSRLGSLPFEEIGKNLNGVLAGANALANDPQLKQAIASLQSTLVTTQTMFANINRGIEPALNRLPGIANGLDDAVKRTDRLIASMETGYGANSQVNRDIARLMVQLSDAARSIRVLADLLARHPEALIRGRTSQGP